MFRTVALMGLALATLGGAYAGTAVPVNLTTSPVYVGTCTNTSATPPYCTPTLPSTATANFENQLFSNVNSPTPPTASSSAQTLGPTQFVLAQQTSPSDNTYMTGNTAGLDTTLQIDLGSCSGLSPSTSCGIFNPDALYTMIQENGAASAGAVVTITLSGINSQGFATTDTIDFTNGIDMRGTNSTQPNTCTVAGCSTGTAQGTDSTPGGSGSNTVTVFNNVLGAETSGSVSFFFDVQEISGIANYFANGYLDSVTIANVAPNGGTTRTLFSGLTVDEASATPEPGTVVLLGAGLGLIGFGKMRARRSKSS